MIHVTDDKLKIILEILEQHAPAVEVWAFGSQQRGTHKKHSDLDSAIVGQEKQPLSVIGDLKKAFIDSTLPFRVDVLDYQSVLPNFRRIIDEEHDIVVKKNG
jgi:type I restriction enzyme S subunit